VIGFRKRPLWLPVVLVSGVASMIAYKYVGSPWHVSLGAAAGILLAAAMAPQLTRRQAILRLMRSERGHEFDHLDHSGWRAC
jgi:predicted branched-subunit amino acid permease